MSIVQIVIMVIGAIGVFVGWSNSKKGAAWGQPVTIVCAIIAIGAALWSSGRTIMGADMKEAQQREVRYQEVQVEKLGLFLAEKYSGKKAVIITDPTYITADGKDPVIVSGLKKGMGSAIEVVAQVSPDIPNSAKSGEGEELMIEPVETWFSAKILDDTLGKVNGDYDLVITTFGLPMNLRLAGKEFGGKLKGKSVVIAGGSIYEFGAAIMKGAIVAAVTYKPNAEYDDRPCPRDLDEAFNKRFLLITPENVKSIVTEYKDVFATK